jgi:hypothetical protein
MVRFVAAQEQETRVLYFASHTARLCPGLARLGCKPATFPTFVGDAATNLIIPFSQGCEVVLNIV